MRLLPRERDTRLIRGLLSPHTPFQAPRAQYKTAEGPVKCTRLRQSEQSGQSADLQ